MHACIPWKWNCLHCNPWQQSHFNCGFAFAFAFPSPGQIACDSQRGLNVNNELLMFYTHLRAADKLQQPRLWSRETLWHDGTMEYLPFPTPLPTFAQQEDGVFSLFYLPLVGNAIHTRGWFSRAVSSMAAVWYIRMRLKDTTITMAAASQCSDWMKLPCWCRQTSIYYSLL